MKLAFIDKSEAVRYLGYGESTPDDKTKQLIDICEQKLLDVIDIRYVYRSFAVEKSPNGIDIGEASLRLEGNDICRHLDGCEKVTLMCVTLSDAVDKLIRRLQLMDMALSVITDSLANAAVEQACDIVEAEITNRHNDMFSTWRFSVGYGDFSIEAQRRIIETLDANKRIGVSVSESFMLTPLKTVTAVIGHSYKEIDRGRVGCVTCNLKDTCNFRKRGEHCGF